MEKWVYKINMLESKLTHVTIIQEKYMFISSCLSTYFVSMELDHVYVLTFVVIVWENSTKVFNLLQKFDF